MNSSTENNQSVVAILKADNKLKAVELLKQHGKYKILWAKSSQENSLDWVAFAIECGLKVTDVPQEEISRDKDVVVGYDSAGTAFYQVHVPVVEEKEISSIVQLQAESRFPLPANQMELAWRTGKLSHNQMSITIAAARRKQIQGFINKVNNLHPERALLDSEGIIKVYKEIFSGREQNLVIVNAGTHKTQICLAEKGLLCNAVTLDIGTVDFEDSDSEEDTETIERLVRDIRSVVDLFGLEKQFEMPVIVLSDGSNIYETLSESLISVGLNARTSKPSLKKLDTNDTLSIEDIFDYREPIGIAILELEGKNGELNLFSSLFNPHGKEKKKSWIYHTSVTAVAAVIMLLMFVMVSYAEIAAGSRAIDKKLSSLGSEQEIDTLVEKQNIIKEVAKHRVDLVALLNEINESGQKSPNAATNSGTPTPQPPSPPGQSGIELESFHFKKNQQVTITGQVQKKEQLEDFEKSLQGNKDISDVLVTAKSNTGTNGNRNQANNKNNGKSPPPAPGGDTPKNGFTYTITFNYKDFTGGNRR